MNKTAENSRFYFWPVVHLRELLIYFGRGVPGFSICEGRVSIAGLQQSPSIPLTESLHGEAVRLQAGPAPSSDRCRWLCANKQEPQKKLAEMRLRTLRQEIE